MFDFKLVDNSDTLHLLEGRHGVIATLNEECLLPKGKDESFVFKVKKHQHGSSKIIDQKLDRSYEFGVEHFAGPVTYDARSFVQTNMDKLPDNLLVGASKSTNSLIKDEFRKLISHLEVHGEGSKTSNKRKKEANKTVMHKFQRQLKGLISAIDGTRTRYIRCIKANASMMPRVTDHASTMKQLECSGLMTALIISRESFPQKLTYDFILSRYACLLDDDEMKRATVDMERQDTVRHALSKWLKPLSKKNRDGTRTMPFACGKTKVFFKPGAQDRLEHLRRQFYEKSSVVIQSWYRVIAAIKLLALRKRSVYKIQSFLRMALVKIHMDKMRAASTVLCAWIRCRLAIASFRMKRNKAVAIQTASRGWMRKNEFKRLRAHIVLIQSIVRMSLARSRMVRLDSAASVISQWIRNCWYAIEMKHQVSAERIQTQWRSFSRQSSFKSALQAAITIQRAWRVCSRCNALAAEETRDAERSFATQSMQEDETQHSTLSMNSIDSMSRSMPISSIEVQQRNNRSDIDSMDNDEKFVAQQKLRELTQRERTRATELEKLRSTFKGRIVDLTKANDGLVKEVFKLRQECELSKKQRRLDALQMDSQFLRVQEEMKRIRRKYEKKVQTTERKAAEAQRRFEEEVSAKQKEISSLETKYATNVEKLRDELRKTQISHQEYLGKLMNILETTQAMREQETTKISAELRAIKKERDSQIFMLQQELKAARAAKGVVITDVEPKPLIDAQGMKKELLNDADEIATCSREFNDTVEKLTNLITASHPLPPVVGPHNMAEVAQQQESAQRMMEMVGMLIDLYSMGEERQTCKNERSLAAVNDYIALSEPNEIIQELRERLAETELENERLRNELVDKEYCRKCGVREEAARRRLGR
jgi:myosin heavy subunit